MESNDVCNGGRSGSQGSDGAGGHHLPGNLSALLYRRQSWNSLVGVDSGQSVCLVDISAHTGKPIRDHGLRVVVILVEWR